jgi:hypothetical protein
MMLYTSPSTAHESGHAMLAVAFVVAALAVLACRLSCDSELGGDLWPADTHVDGMVDERREFRLCVVPHVPGVLDLLKHPGCRGIGDPSRRACGFC